MAARYFAIAVLFAVFVPAPFPVSAAATPAKPVHHACAAAPTGAHLEPPNVDAWNLPIDAGGRRELILAVRSDGDRFCYRYTMDGRTETVAPTIRVRRGERFAIRVVNEISGPSAAVHAASTRISPCMPMPMPPATLQHFTGYLNHEIDERWIPKMAVDTNLHLHGFEGPSSQENVFLSTLSTPMHACEYAIDIPRTQPPGTYFYHPHVHAASQIEVAGGLSGVWIVEPDTPQIDPANDRVLILRYRTPAAFDDPYVPNDNALYFNAARREAALPSVSAAQYDPFDPPPWPLTIPMSGRGAMSLDPRGCNGIQAEGMTHFNAFRTAGTLEVADNTTQLLRIVNATSDSPKLLRLRDEAGRPVPMRIVELDGVPVGGDMLAPLSGYLPLNDLMLPPASRAALLLSVAPGQSVTLSSEHFCEGAQAQFQMAHDLLKITGTPTASPGPIVASSRIDAANTPAAKLVAYVRSHTKLVRRRAITFTEYMFPARGKIPLHSAFYITDTTNPAFREHSYYPVFASGADTPSAPDIVVKHGTLEEWYLFNTTMEAHTFHAHQMAFVLENGPGNVPVFVDGAFLRVGTLQPNHREPDYPLVKPSVTKVVLDFRHVPRGTFVVHCHMLFHEDRGMMATVKVT